VICGTGVTAIVHLATAVYDALKRGVSFEVFVLHPLDSLVERLAEMESDLEKVVIHPMVEAMKTDEELRKLLGPEWCEKALTVFEGDGTVCSLHKEGHHDCALHGRVICTSAEVWKRVEQQVTSLNPGKQHGNLSVSGYRTIPSVKAWRFSSGPSESSSLWYYVADHLYHRGVGLDNPMRRFERGSEGPSYINIKLVEAYLDRVKKLSDPLYPAPLVQLESKTRAGAGT
jgi:hypothetical protein